MWSFSFAGSMRSSTALIGRAEGEGAGDGLGGAVAIGVAPATWGDGEVAGDVVAPPQDAKTIATTMRWSRTVSVYRMSREISASALAEESA